MLTVTVEVKLPPSGVIVGVAAIVLTVRLLRRMVSNFTAASAIG